MSVFEKFFRETFDDQGRLIAFDVQYPPDFNYGYDVVDAIAAETPDKRALVWCNTEGEERIFTFDDIRRLSNQAANVFLNAGIRKGDYVITSLKRHYEYWITAIALHKIGAVLTPVTYMLTAEDLVYRLRSAKIAGIVCTPEGDVPQRVAEAVATVEKEGLHCKVWSAKRSVLGFENFTAAMEAASDQLERQPTKATEPIILYFTSGTTGEPKGVLHSHTYPLGHALGAKYWHQVREDGLHFTVADTGWSKTSWGKIYGQWLAGTAVMVFDFDNFDPRQLVTVINRYGVTTFCAPPTIYRYLVRKEIAPMPTLCHATSAGELLNPEVSRRFSQFTGLPINEGYGQTEGVLLLGNFKGYEPQAGSVGIPTPQYQIELMRRDGTPAETGELGEIVIRPTREDGLIPGIFVAYLNDEEQYKYVWRYGVYHTGDSAIRDENGYYWFQGRFDDLIKTGGYRVGPYEVENILMEHPAVVECSVVGVPDPLRGQAIKAIIILDSGYEPTHALEKELREFCNSRMAEYKWVRIVEFVREMPKTFSGKIQKYQQRKKK
ncbi:MAG: AMP-binding protein [Oscillospiraceae bacterium]|nr:AMP-binding protein [Oscillospiraceae bacterium]